jgi:hypothetical protein
MAESIAPWRASFLKALELLAQVSEAMHVRGLPRPVLVGGGAVELYTSSAIMTGDIDLCSPAQPELEEELRRLGFVKPSGRGVATRGWVHPDLGLGFEVVSSAPLDGQADPDRMALILLDTTRQFVRVLSVEDMIADRMGQYASGSAPEMLDRPVLSACLGRQSKGAHPLRTVPSGRSRLS